MLNIVKMTNKTEALNIPEWKIDMSRNFIKRTIFADGFDDEFFQKLKEINSPAKSNAPSEEEIVEVNGKKEIIPLRPKLVRIKTSRGDKLL